MARFYKVSNQQMYTSEYGSTGPWSPVFIVGTDFAFGNDAFYTNTAQSNWTGTVQKANRLAAGNTVFMWGNYFGTSTYGDDGNFASQRISDRFAENSSLTFFMVDMNLWRSGDGMPRGAHTPVSLSGYCVSGHWLKAPHANYMDDGVETDNDYIAAYSDTNDSTYWNQTTNLYGTEVWHSSWLSGVVNPASNDHYDSLAAWSLIDEAYNPDFYRDYAENHVSVSGHHSFCTAAEGSTENARLKMVSLHTAVNTHWDNLSSVLDIVNGNNYNTAPARVWTTPNMVAWFKQKVGTTSDKMIIPWIQDVQANISMSYYFFYGSIIEGARGILWWNDSNQDYSSYSNQRTIRADFISGRAFRPAQAWDPSYTGGKDEDFILSGQVIPLTFRSNPDFTRSAYEQNFSRYGKVLTKQFSALVHKYSGYYRIFVVNHEHMDNTSGTFQLRINTNELSNSGWTKAVDNDGTLHNLTNDDQTASYKVLSDTMNSNIYYRIYEIGSAVQNLT